MRLLSLLVVLHPLVLTVLAQIGGVPSSPSLPLIPPSAPNAPTASSLIPSGVSSPPSSSTNPPPLSVPTGTSSGSSSSSASSTPTTYSFTPFPTPTEQPIPGVFPAAGPQNPPPVDSSLIPDFYPAWAAAYEKAKAMISGFSLEDKVNITTGVGWMGGRCVGNTPPVQSANGTDWPGLCLEDSPLGVRFADHVTAFPAGINVATTFNRKMMRLRGHAMGTEHRGKGVNIALGPMMNIGRVAQGGRNWEGFGADPFLAGEAAYETILGMQQGGVQACAKHLINNEQEHFRTQESSNVDDRTEHEIYTQPFLKSIMAGVTSIMCSYNLINNTYACQNDKVMNNIIKREFGFQGFIMSDWAATMSTLSAVAGLDMTMPGDITFNSGTSYFGGNLTAYVENGTISEARVDDMATRIIAGWYLLGQDSPSYPETNFNAFFPLDEATNEHVDVQDDHADLVRQIDASSTVLLKNVNGALPLKKPMSLALIGSDAGPGGAGPNQFSDQGGDEGILAMGWGSGTAWFPYLISPYEAIQRRAAKDHTTFAWTFRDFDLTTAASYATQKSAAIVFINADSGEDYIIVDGNEGDRNNLTAWHAGDQLVLTVAAQNNNTIVVVHSVGPLILEPWIEHPNVTAVLWAGLGGQETGNALVDVLYGDWNPSGRLPYTIAKQPSDYPTQLITADPGGLTAIVEIPYTEGLFIDYRYFDAKKITPRFEFGFGLSYTQFKYSNLQVSKVYNSDNTQAGSQGAWDAGQPSPSGQGSSTAIWLHRPAYQVTFNVKNVGSLYGTEIPQLYVNMDPSSGEPPSLLKGFTDVVLASGETKPVTIQLSRYDLSIWDTVAQGWRRPEGKIGLSVGASSRDIRLRGAIPS
ncbi:glycoside hydrolase family 3 protein [Amanita rubescens]|nr:glycoside hydrolase family 3 protein [Amanita rubescens]